MPNVVGYRKVSSRHAAPRYTVAASSRLTLSAPAAMDGSSETDFDPSVPLARASLDSPGGEGAGGRLAGLEDAFFLGGPAVRISLAPPASQVQWQNTGAVGRIVMAFKKCCWQDVS